MRVAPGLLRPTALLLTGAALAAGVASCGESNHSGVGRQRSGDGVSGAPTPNAPTRQVDSGDAQSGKGDGSLTLGAAAFAPQPATIKEPGKLTIRIPLTTQDRAIKASLLSLQASQVLPEEYTGKDAGTLTIATAKLDGPGRLDEQAQTMDFRIDCVRGGTNTRYNNRNGFKLTLPKNSATTLVVGVVLGRTFPGQLPTLELQSPSLPSGGSEIPIGGLGIKSVAGVSLSVAQGDGSASYTENTKAGKPLVDGEVVHVGPGKLTATGNVFGGQAGQPVELVARRVRQQDPEAAFIPLGEPEDLQAAVTTGSAIATARTNAQGDYTIALPKPPGRSGYLVKFYARVAASGTTTAGASCPASVVTR